MEDRSCFHDGATDPLPDGRLGRVLCRGNLAVRPAVKSQLERTTFLRRKPLKNILKIESVLSSLHFVGSRPPESLLRESIAGQHFHNSGEAANRSAIVRDTGLHDFLKVTEIPAVAMDPLSQTELQGDGLANVVDVVAIEMVSRPKSSKPALVVECFKVHTIASDSWPNR